jgi:hypothetical protein
MMKELEIGDEVLVFGKYEGTLSHIVNAQVLVYCPSFDKDAPWLVTDISNVVLLPIYGQPHLVN